MGQFSLTHWIIVLLILVPTVALPIVPSWRIARKAGFNGAWCLLLLVPGLNVLAIWAFAFTRWPNSQDGNDKTSVSALVWGALLLAMMVLGIVLLPMLEKQIVNTAQQGVAEPRPAASSTQTPPDGDGPWKKYQQPDRDRGALAATPMAPTTPTRQPANRQFDPSTARLEFDPSTARRVD